jgi:hypothetical protein
MKSPAFGKAEFKLRQAEAAQSILAEKGEVQILLGAWVDFVIAINGVFAALEQGAKRHPTSGPWYDRVKQARYDDELLNYLQLTRNAHEHGIDTGLVKREYTKIEASDGSTIRVTSVKVGDKFRPQVEVPASVGINIRAGSDTYLGPVRTKRGQRFAPPTKHLNQGIPSATPAEAAALAIAYCRTIIAEARAMVEL